MKIKTNIGVLTASATRDVGIYRVNQWKHKCPSTLFVYGDEKEPKKKQIVEFFCTKCGEKFCGQILS